MTGPAEIRVPIGESFSPYRELVASAELKDGVKRTASVDPDIAYAVAAVFALLNESDEAFDWLNRSVALGNENKILFEHDPNLASLRDDLRFGESG